MNDEDFDPQKYGQEGQDFKRWQEEERERDADDYMNSNYGIVFENHTDFDEYYYDNELRRLEEESYFYNYDERDEC